MATSARATSRCPSTTYRFARKQGIPVVPFQEGQDKEAAAKPLIEAAAQEGGPGRVVMIGIAREKGSAWRSWKAKGHENAADPNPDMEWGRQMAFVNHFYFYLYAPALRFADPPVMAQQGVLVSQVPRLVVAGHTPSRRDARERSRR